MRALIGQVMAPTRAGLSVVLNGRSENGRIVQSAVAMSGMRTASLALAFVASILYARVLGAHGYGIYAYVLAWSGLLATISCLGIPAYLVREIAKDEASAPTLIRWADRALVLAGTLAAGGMLLAAWLSEAKEARWLFLVAAPIPLLSNLAAARQSRLHAAGHVVRSQWPPQVLAPVLVLATLLACVAIGRRPSPLLLCATTTLASLSVLVASELQVRQLATRASPGGPSEPSLRAAFGFMWLGILFLVNGRTDLLMLGAMSSSEQAGIYAVASRAAELVGFFLFTSNFVMAPIFTRLHAQADIARLQQMVTSATRRVSMLTVPVALSMLIFARPLLADVYGPEFASGALTMQILIVGQLINVLAGPTATLLNMTGHVRLTNAGLAMSAVANVLLNALLIPRFGAPGAATATAASLVLWNVILWRFVRREVGVRPSWLFRWRL